MLLEPIEDQAFLRDTTAKFLADAAPPQVLRTLRDDEAGFDEAYWRQGVELGWTSLLVSEEAGGGSVSGDGLVDLSLIAHEFGAAAAPGPLAPNAVVAGALARSGGHDEVVAGVLSGGTLVSWAIDEDAHNVAAMPRLFRFRIEGTELVLDGTKRLVESANRSDYLLVTGVTPGGITQVLVATDAAGIEIRPMHTVDLTRRFSVVTFNNVRVPLDAVVGSIDTAAEAVKLQRRQAIVIANAESVGAMQRAFDLTLEWTFDRYSFGRSLASYQAIKHRMASMKMWLEASHAIAGDAAAAVAADSPRAEKLVRAAAAYIGEYGSELMQECVQFHGGIGVTYEHDLHLYLRRHTLNRALHGTPAQHRRRVAVELDLESAVS